MKNTATEILSDVEAVLPAEAILYSSKNPAIKILKDQIEDLINQLRIVEKAGAIDDIAEREGPVLCSSILQKSKELHELLTYEKGKEKRRELFKVDSAEYDIKESEHQAKENKSSSNQAAMNKIYIARQSAEAIDKKINILAKHSRSYADSNLHVVAAVGAILIAVQLAFNFAFDNRLKTTAREQTVQNLETRLKQAEDRNLQLSQSLSLLHREVAFQKSINLKMPKLSNSATNQYRKAQKNRSNLNNQTAKKSTKKRVDGKTRYISSQSNYGRR